MLGTLYVPVLLFTQTFRMFSCTEKLWLVIYAVVVKNLNICYVGLCGQTLHNLSI